MNKIEFEVAMKRYGDNQSTLAKALGMSRTTLNSKLNENKRASFTQPEISAIKDRYNLTAQEIEEIFFTNVVS